MKAFWESVQPYLLLSCLIVLSYVIQFSEPAGASSQCRSVVFNFTAILIPEDENQNCPDLCKLAFDNFQSTLTKAILGKTVQQRRRKQKAAQEVLQQSDNECIYSKRWCFNGRLAWKGRVRPAAISGVSGASASHPVYRKPHTSEYHPTTVAGCFCRQSLALFTLRREDIPGYAYARPRCAINLVCEWIARFVSESPEFIRLKRLEGRPWNCHTDQMRVFKETTPCILPKFTPSCSACSVNCKQKYQLYCPRLVPYNLQELERYDALQTELQQEFAAAAAAEDHDYENDDYNIDNDQLPAASIPNLEPASSMQAIESGPVLTQYLPPTQQFPANLADDHGLGSLPHRYHDPNAASSSRSVRQSFHRHDTHESHPFVQSGQSSNNLVRMQPAMQLVQGLASNLDQLLSQTYITFVGQPSAGTGLLCQSQFQDSNQPSQTQPSSSRSATDGQAARLIETRAYVLTADTEGDRECLPCEPTAGSLEFMNPQNQFDFETTREDEELPRPDIP